MRRYLFTNLYQHLEKKPYTIIVGARQTGKTTLLKQLRDTAKSEGKDTFFFNMEQMDVRAEMNADPMNLLKYIPHTETKKYIFIDEIQYLEDPSNFLKLIFDDYSDRMKIVATGSSAFYIDKKFKDSLAGRKRVFQLGTCSFEEYLEMREETELLREWQRLSMENEAKTTMLSALRAALDDYIIYGGYPAVVCEDDPDEKIALLKELRDSYLQRDISEAGITNSDKFYKLYTLLAAQTGTEVNVSELSKTIGASGPSVESYLNVLQKSFHIALIIPFYRNIKKELVKMPKAYVMDTGMRNCLINYFPATLGLGDDGALFENFIYHRLRERYTEEDIKYWRTSDQKEVDFVVDAPRTKAAYEVKNNQAQVRPKKYRTFDEAYPEFGLDFLSKEPLSEKTIWKFTHL